MGKLGESCHQAFTPILDAATYPEDKPFTIAVAASGSIRGKLIGAERPGDYAVLLLPEGASAPALQITSPTDKGQFEFSALAPGRYRIAAQPAGGLSSSRWISAIARMVEIEVAGGSATEIDLPVAPRGER